MKNKSFIIFGFIAFCFVIILFSIIIDYKLEDTKTKQTFNSGIFYIDGKKVKLPISLEEFKEQFDVISFKSESYDENNYYYYNVEKNKSNTLQPYTTVEGIIKMDKYDMGVFISNLSSKAKKIKSCYIVGVRIKNTKPIKLFKNINTNLSLKEIDNKLKTGRLNPFKEEYPNLLRYKKDYIIDITYDDKNKIMDIAYYFDYSKCKEKSCSNTLN